jgi:hypothetical protein
VHPAVVNRALDAGSGRIRPDEHLAWQPLGGEADDGPDDVTPDDLRPYPVRWQRPRAQLAARLALWAAVVIGCVGGLVGLTSPATEPAAEPTAAVAEDVPGPVAGIAERAVAAWMTDAGDRSDSLAGLFVEPVQATRNGGPLDIGEVTTVAGSAAGPGYWWVTVAVDVTEMPSDGAPPPDGGDGSAATDGSAPPENPVTTTWYVQVAVVGELESRLAVLTTPQVLPIAPALPDEWRRVEGAVIEAGAGPYDTVEGFLRALLLGDGDPARYMTPGWSIETSATPMFTSLEITGMRLAAPAGEVSARVRVEGVVTTPGASRRDVAYTVEAVERDGRWEVTEMPGGPTVELVPGATSGATTTTSPPPTTAGSEPVVVGDESGDL